MKTRQELVEAVREGTFQETGSLYDRDTIESFITAIEAAGARVVPEVATAPMVEAGVRGFVCSDTDVRDLIHDGEIRSSYTAMLNASPFKGETE